MAKFMRKNRAKLTQVAIVTLVLATLAVVVLHTIHPVDASSDAIHPAAASNNTMHLAAAVSNDYPWGNAVFCGSSTDPYDWCVNGRDTSPLRFVYRNCTDYAAYEVNEQLGGTVANQMFNWTSINDVNDNHNGNAAGWKNGAIERGYPVDNTPMVGAVAWWDNTVAHGFGHVGIVASVSTDGNSIVVDSYNGLGDGNFLAETISKTTPGPKTHLSWPKAFIHIAQYILALKGTTEYAKSIPSSTSWGTALTTKAVGIQVAGVRFAYLDASHTLYVRQGLSGAWNKEAGSVSQYVITPTYIAPNCWWSSCVTPAYIVIRQGTIVKAKSNPAASAGWTTLTTSMVKAADIQAAGKWFAFRDASLNLWVRVGLTGALTKEASGVNQYVITPACIMSACTTSSYTSAYIVIRQGKTMKAKSNPAASAGWTTLSTTAINIRAARGWFAYTDATGNLWVRAGIGGKWYNQGGGLNGWAITSGS